MTVENETTRKISNEQLLIDIVNTEKERDAYEQLRAGYFTLSLLPENQESGESRVHSLKSEHYQQLCFQCQEFLNKLIALQKERGI